jgi:hypothetical protein
MSESDEKMNNSDSSVRISRHDSVWNDNLGDKRLAEYRLIEMKTRALLPSATFGCIFGIASFLAGLYIHIKAKTVVNAFDTTDTVKKNELARLVGYENFGSLEKAVFHGMPKNYFNYLQKIVKWKMLPISGALVVISSSTTLAATYFLYRDSQVKQTE